MNYTISEIKEIYKKISESAISLPDWTPNQSFQFGQCVGMLSQLIDEHEKLLHELEQIKKVAAQWQSAALELSAKLKELEDLQKKITINIPKIK